MTVLKLYYLVLTIIMLVVILLITKHTLKNTFGNVLAKKTWLQVFFGLAFFHLYIWGISLTGWMQDFSFPPKFALLTIVPLFLFTGIFIYKNRNRKWIQNIPPHWLVFYQSMRIFIEIIFVYTVAENILHPNVTIEGYNYDMLFGATAPIIGLLLMRNFSKYKKLTVYWNYIGLLVIAFIIFLFMTTLYCQEIYGENIQPFPNGFTAYPYILIPSFLMPSAVFMHVLSIVQLNEIVE